MSTPAKPWPAEWGANLQIVQADPEVQMWCNGVLNPRNGAGDFLQAMATAALHADWENYPILRPALFQLLAKYPAYLLAERKAE